MKDDNFYQIKGYMFNKLKLSASEAMVYAFISSFDNGFEGSLQYIADSTGMSKRQTIRVIEKLIEKSYLRKEGQERKICKYSVVKMSPTCCQNVTNSVVKMSHNNNKHTNNYNKGSFNDFNQRIYNFSELEKMIRSN